MKSALGSALVVQTICLLLNISAPGAETNYWLKSTDGLWHQAEWSLGTFPRASQSVALVSPQSKTLVISATTARDRPNSLQISNLFVFAPHHSQNHLLLSNIGLSYPLRVGSVFNLSENAVLTLLDSTLRVGREFQVNSTVNHGAASQVIAADLHVGAGLTAYYNFTNGLISAGTLIVGYRSPAMFQQFGGRVAAAVMDVREANYFLRGGEISAGSMAIANPYEPYFFFQDGGAIVVTNGVEIAKGDGHGRYILSAGLLTSERLRVGAVSIDFVHPARGVGEFVQNGGTNSTASFTVGRSDSYWGLGTYRLTGGLLVYDNGSISEGGFEQSGGVHEVSGSLALLGSLGPAGPVGEGHYRLSSGKLSCESLHIRGGPFEQAGGTNEVTLSLWLMPYEGSARYELTAGRLVTGHVGVYPGRNGRPSHFRHTGGVHEIAGYLNLGQTLGESSAPVYEFTGGELVAGEIHVGSRATFRHTGGHLTLPGTLTLAGGQWQSSPGDHSFGALQLEDGYTNSTLALPLGRAVLRFGSSAALSWHTFQAHLIIYGWTGSETGGGQHQIFFGTNATGLTAQQLTQLRFRNPPGYAPGDYPATILPGGEVVPILPTRPRLAFTWAPARTNMIHFHFAEGLRLQAATNVSGPFSDLPALSPFPIILTNGPRRFFRLREP